MVTSTGQFSIGIVLLPLALKLKSEGKKVGYFKPVGLSPVVVDGKAVDKDVLFMKENLGLSEPAEKLCGIVVTGEQIDSMLGGNMKSPLNDVKKAMSEIDKGKDITLVAGAGSLEAGAIFGLSDCKIAEIPEMKVLFVARYERKTLFDQVAMAEQLFGKKLTGIIVNCAPPAAHGEIEKLKTWLSRQKISFFGAIPYDELLGAVSVKKLSEELGGEIICRKDKINELVEHFMVGAMNVESALKYFRRQTNKAVITGGDRSDIQLAALETHTMCLILTGGLTPSAPVLARAEETGVPMMLLNADTSSTLEKIEEITGHMKLREKEKLSKVVELFNRHIKIKVT